MMIEAMACTELTAAAMRLPSKSVEALSRDNEAGAILHSNCHGGARRTVETNIFECRANIVANGPHKCANQIRAKVAKRHEPKIGENFAKSKQPSDLLFQIANAPARGINIWMTMLAKVLPRENSPVFFVSELPMLQQDSRMSTVL